MIPEYVPILKAKRGEFDALGNLSNFTGGRITPLFDVTRMSTRSAKINIEEYLANIAIDISHTRKGKSVFIDVRQRK